MNQEKAPGGSERSAFCFKFDESATNQVKKQYNANFTYYSLLQKEIVTYYCNSLFGGHCTAEHLIKHIHKFMNRYDYMITLVHVACTLQTMLLGEVMATLREFVNLDQINIDLLWGGEVDPPTKFQKKRKGFTGSQF